MGFFDVSLISEFLLFYKSEMTTPGTNYVVIICCVWLEQLCLIQSEDGKKPVLQNLLITVAIALRNINQQKLFRDETNFVNWELLYKSEIF